MNSMAYRLNILWTPGTRGTPFGIYELQLNSEPYPNGGFNGFEHLKNTPLIALADSGDPPGYIYRYDYTMNRVRIYQFNSGTNTVYEIPANQNLTLRVRFFAVYDFVGNAP